MRRLLLLLLTVLGCWLGSGPAGLTYAEPASPVSTYTYDVPADLSMVAEVTANRGPPSSTYGYGTYDAVDRWSHGAQARPETTLSPSTTTHAHTGVLTQAVRATTTTGAQVGSTHGDFSSLHRSGVAAKTAARACSFSGATLVLMADGTKKPIDQVKVGDKVLATDPETGEQKPKKVEHVFVHDDALTDLQLADGTVLTTTEDHPYWSVDDQRFERADELSQGERVLGADGRTIRVSGLQLVTTRDGLAYNLAVEGIHTYHVGDDAILVHNACVIPSASNYRKLFTDAHPNMPSGYQVHHALPQEYEGIMQRAGVNIHDPSMLRGVDPTIHSKITTAWGRWERGLGRTPTAHDITQFSYRIDEMYGSSFVW